MDVSLLGVMAWWKLALAAVFMLVCVVLVILVLLQKGRGGGLSAAFGGAGGQSAFGSKTGDVFTWVTIVVAAFFLLLAMVMSPNFTPEDPDKEDLTGSASGGPRQEMPTGQTPGGMPPPMVEPPPPAPLPEPSEQTEEAGTTEETPAAGQQPAQSGPDEGE